MLKNNLFLEPKTTLIHKIRSHCTSTLLSEFAITLQSLTSAFLPCYPLTFPSIFTPATKCTTMERREWKVNTLRQKRIEGRIPTTYPEVRCHNINGFSRISMFPLTFSTSTENMSHFIMFSSTEQKLNKEYFSCSIYYEVGS